MEITQVPVTVLLTMADKVKALEERVDFLASLEGVSKATQTYFQIDGPTSTVRDLRYSTNNSLRWILRTDSTAETGSNAGSNFQISRRNDAGDEIGTAVFIQRSNGRIGIGTNAPDLEVDVQSASTAYTGIELTNTDTTTRRWAIGANSNGTSFGPSKGFIIRDVTAGGTRFSIGTNGDITIVGRFTMEANAAPAAPASGGTLWVDGTDGDLKIIFANGTIKTIATN